jgi:heme-degrading monooxygenase HmoA
VDHHLAQLNIGRVRAPLASDQLSGFVAALEPVNALADRAPGFVWRLQTEDGDATAIRAFDDDMLLVNMSVWESLEALADFVYRSDHREVMSRRRQWFERMDEKYLVLWWVDAGHLPTLDEAKDRLERLRRDGPSAEAFTFRSPFPPPGSDDVVGCDDRWSCPTG